MASTRVQASRKGSKQLRKPSTSSGILQHAEEIDDVVIEIVVDFTDNVLALFAQKHRSGTAEWLDVPAWRGKWLIIHGASNRAPVPP